MGKNIATTSMVRKLDAKNSVFCNVAGSLRQVTLEDLSTSLGEIHTTQALRTVWNTGQPSTVLQQSGNRDVLIDYLQACKRYVFNASGTKKAEIAYVEQFENLGTSIVHFVGGYSTTVNALNDAGCNWMTLRPELGFLSTEEDGVPVFYCAGRGSIAGGHSFPKKYVGMFKAYLQGEVLKSQPARVPTGAQSLNYFLQRAKNGNSLFGLYNYSDWCKDNMIHLAYFGNTNYEENVGIGLINDLKNNENIVSGICLADMNNQIVSYGTSPCKDSQGNSVNRVHFFGLEGLGEQFQETVNGIKFVNDKVYVWDTNETFINSTSSIMRSFTRPGTKYFLCVKMIGGEFFDLISSNTMLDELTSGTYNKYFCDANGGIIHNDSSEYSLRVGGNGQQGSKSGISNGFYDSLISYDGSYNKVRISFYGEPLTVGGSEILS